MDIETFLVIVLSIFEVVGYLVYRHSRKNVRLTYKEQKVGK